MSDEHRVDAFVKFGEMAGTWGSQYDEAALLTTHSANRFRLRIALELLRRAAPARVLDVGCGSGEPLVAMLRAGFDAWGFDRAEAMVVQARRTLAAAGFPEDRVFEADMERIEPDGRRWDALVALGAVYYAQDFPGTMRRLSALVAPGGHFIFSLRNDLFSLFSLNEYTQDFFMRALLPAGDLPPDRRREVETFLAERLRSGDVERRFQTVDDQKIRSRFDNPLTVRQDVLDPLGLTLEGVYFYHFHALPPVFEHKHPEEFRRLSAAMEQPTDWRGLFMASAFVVHARRPADGDARV